jgi:mRNA interferase MazF
VKKFGRRKLVTSGQNQYVPDRGDIVWLDFDPQSGHEQAGRRPALVLSELRFNNFGFALICPITNTVRNNRFEVHFPLGFTISGVVLTNQVKSLDWRSRNLTFICQCPQIQLNEALAKVRALVKQ